MVKLLDLSYREEFESGLDDNKEKSQFVIGPLTARQMFSVYNKNEQGLNGSNAANANVAIDFARLGLKKVKGPLGKGFKVEKCKDYGFECNAVKFDYLDTLPVQLLLEIGGWVTEVSKLGEKGKKG